jgi:hypothetical protein
MSTPDAAGKGESLVYELRNTSGCRQRNSCISHKKKHAVINETGRVACMVRWDVYAYIYISPVSPRYSGVIWGSSSEFSDSPD